MSETEQEQVAAEEADAEAAESPAEPEPANPDAEPLEPLEGPQESDAQPSAPPEAQGMSDKEREKQQKALDNESKRHTARIADLLGEDANEAIICPLCDPQLQGFLYPESLNQPRDETQARMIAVLRTPAPAEYPPARDVQRCEVCDGWGSVSTGARKAGNETKACSNCLGYGYYPPPGLRDNGRMSEQETGELVAVGAPPMVQEDADAWGSPRLLADGQENPNYGRMPQYKNANLP